MKRFVYLMLVCILFGGLTGCSKRVGDGDSGNENVTKEETSAKTEVKFVSADYQPGNTRIRKTDKGYYYLNRGLRYTDAATGKDMYLCNKPECRHDGNEFCVATNEKYRFNGFCIYSGTLVAAMIEETDTQYLYKLFTIALDGSQMNELVTYYTFEKGQGEACYGYDSPLIIHRNKVILPIAIKGQEALEDTYSYGMAIYDLDTEKVTFLDEEAVSRENPESTNISVYGDYVYYCRKEGKKTVLHRRHLTEGTDEAYKLLTGFGGTYIVLDDDTVVYSKKLGRVLCIHHHETGENEEKVTLLKKVTFMSDGQPYESTIEDEVQGLCTDGTYVYAFGTYVEIRSNDGTEEQTGQRIQNLYVFDRTLEEVTVINRAEDAWTITWEDVGEVLYPGKFSFIGDEVYVKFSSVNLIGDEYVFQCKRSDLLAGTPQFEFAYSSVYREK